LPQQSLFCPCGAKALDDFLGWYLQFPRGSLS
jgi:hypothetical protein